MYTVHTFAFICFIKLLEIKIHEAKTLWWVSVRQIDFIFVKKQRHATTNKVTGSAVINGSQGSHRRYSVLSSTGPTGKDCFMLRCVMYCMLANAVTMKQNIIQWPQRLKDSKTGVVQFSETRKVIPKQ